MDWKNNILAPVVVATMVSGAIYFLDVASKAPELIVPTGAVIPFNLTRCPPGWTEYTRVKGRTIIGAGKGDGLKDRALGETGGYEMHSLTVDEIPAHNHKTWYYTEIFQKGGHTGALTKETGGDSLNITFTGGGKPHNNMQPWVALLYCEKE